MRRNRLGQFTGKKIPAKAIKILDDKRDSEIAKIFNVHRYTVAQWRDKLNIKTPLKKWSYDYNKCRLCKSTKYKHRWKGYCQKCWTKSPEYKKKRLDWYYNNKLKVKLSRQKFYKKNKVRILKQTAEYKIRNKIRCSDNYPAIYWVNRIELIYNKKLPCWICGCKKINELETHHIIPIKIAKQKGWDDKKIHSKKNLLVVCKECHRIGLNSIH